MNPKVFVSHASEDRERFVVKFATKLRENGVDAWLDKWEMLPGDSLVDKIFEEGLKEADAVVIVLSNHSINKPWVREELNVSIVNRLSKGTKIIPLVLDNCNVPEALKSTLWEPFSNLNSYNNSFSRVLSSILGVTDKPAIGNLPIHTTSPYYEIYGLAKIDNLILKEACNYLLKKDQGHTHIDPDVVFGNGKNLGFSRDEIKDSIEILEKSSYFDVSHFAGGGSGSYGCSISVSNYGFIEYLQSYFSSYNDVTESVIGLIVNESIRDNVKIKEVLNEPLVVINQIILNLESQGHVELAKYADGSLGVSRVSVSLKRVLT